MRLDAPKSGTRPLSDRVKQALFATLEAKGALVDGFLDLYAGTGAGGIEALSRGATHATFVERDPAVAELIEQNLARAKLHGGRVVRSNVLRFVSESRPEPGGAFRAALIDPPYDQPLVAPTLQALSHTANGWLARGAVVVAKHFWRSAPPADIGNLHLERQRRFGETVLSFYRFETEGETGQR